MTIKDLKNLTEDEARKLLEGVLWPNGPVCPHCGNCDQERIGNVAANPTKKVRAGLKQCKECRKQFTVTVNTVFASSKLLISTWLYIIASMCASKRGISAKQLQREFGSANYEAFWFACHRIHHAMADQGIVELLGGDGKILEADETLVGGRPRYPQKGVATGGRGDKTPVMTLVERGGGARSVVLTDVNAMTLRAHLWMHGSLQSRLMTDEYKSYKWPGKLFASHETTNHSRREYARGDIHSNTAESFFSVLKRSIYGVHMHWSKVHMHRYVSERDFAWTTRKVSDVERALMAVGKASGMRLMYAKPKGTPTGAN